MIAQTRTIFRTQAELATALGVKVRAVRENLAAGMPRETDGTYCYEDCLNWRLQNVHTRVGGIGGERPPMSDLEREKLEEEIRYKRLKNDQTEGLLVDRQAAEQEINAMLVRLKTRLEAAPDEMEMRFPAETRADNKAEFQNYVHNLLKEISSWGSQWDQEISSPSQ